MAIFGKLFYEGGHGVGTLLPLRFGLAALVFWGLLVAGGGLAELRKVGRRDLTIALALGAAGYSAQAGAYFAALERVDASLLSLVLYTFPAMVAVAAVALGRERFSSRRLLALVLALGGLTLVLGGAGAGALDPVGIALGLLAAVVYTGYILAGQGAAGRLRPQVLATLVCTGAALTLLPVTVALGSFHPGRLAALDWGWVACMAVISTVVAVSLFFAGLRRVGPTTASILSTFEPVVTVLLAFLVFAEVLSAAQLLGGALVIGGVLVLHARLPRAALREQLANE